MAWVPWSWNQRCANGSASYHSAVRHRRVLRGSARRARPAARRALQSTTGRDLRELRFDLDRRSVRVTYWIAPGRRIVLLTTFTKTRMREDREIERARRALARCIAHEHTVDETEEAGNDD